MEVAALMSEYAQKAVEVAAADGLRLDFTDGSIEFLEALLGHLHDRRADGEMELSDHQLDELSFMFGGYLGEVLRRRCGGKWSEDEAFGLPATLNIPGVGVISPPAKVRKRLENGPVENIVHYYRTIRKMVSETRIRERQASGPVTLN